MKPDGQALSQPVSPNDYKTWQTSKHSPATAYLPVLANVSNEPLPTSIDFIRLFQQADHEDDDDNVDDESGDEGGDHTDEESEGFLEVELAVGPGSERVPDPEADFVSELKELSGLLSSLPQELRTDLVDIIRVLSGRC